MTTTLNSGLKVRQMERLNVTTGSTRIKVYPLPDVNDRAARVKQFGKAYAAKWESKGGIIPLDLGDCEASAVSNCVTTVRRTLTDRTMHYSAMSGEPALRTVLADNLGRLFGVVDATDKDFLVIPGSRFAGLGFSFIVLNSFGRGQIGVVNPSWATMSQQALMVGGSERLVEAELPYHPGVLFTRLTPSVLKEFLETNPNITGLVLINPCNPTGQIATPEEMLEIARIIVSMNKGGRNLFVHQDMTYGYVGLRNQVVPLEAVAQSLSESDRRVLFEHVVTTYGLQKLLGSGGRVAAVFSKAGEFLKSMAGVLGHMVGPANKATQLEAAAYYSDYDAIDSANAELLTRRNLLAGQLEIARVRLRELHGEDLFEHTLGGVAAEPRSTPTGGYYAVLRLNPKAAERICKAMTVETLTEIAVMEFFAKEVGTTVQPGATMRLGNDHIRLAFGAAITEQIQLFGDRLVNAFG